MFWAVPWVTAQSDYEVPESPIALTAKVLDIFSKSCAECHDANSGKRVKGDFDHVMDLELQLEDEYYLFAGDPEGSENFLLMITDDEDALMPPPESDVHKPTPEEIEIVRAWISPWENTLFRPWRRWRLTKPLSWPSLRRRG